MKPSEIFKIYFAGFAFGTIVVALVSAIAWIASFLGELIR